MIVLSALLCLCVSVSVCLCVSVSAGRLIIPSAPRPSGATIEASAQFRDDYMGDLFPTQWLFDREEDPYPAIFPKAALKSRKASVLARRSVPKL